MRWAVEFDHPEVAALLLDAGAVGLEARDEEDGATLLHWAAEGGSAGVAVLLLDRGADLEARDRFGQTPLHWTTRGFSFRVAEVLLDRGADPNARTEDGETPLHVAALWHGPEAAAVALLLDRDADVEARDEGYGATPPALGRRGWPHRNRRLAARRGRRPRSARRGRMDPPALGRRIQPLPARPHGDRSGVEPPSPDVVPPMPTPFMFRREDFLEVAPPAARPGADLEARNGDGQTPLDLPKRTTTPRSPPCCASGARASERSRSARPAGRPRDSSCGAWLDGGVTLPTPVAGQIEAAAKERGGLSPGATPVRTSACSPRSMPCTGPWPGRPPASYANARTSCSTTRALSDSRGSPTDICTTFAIRPPTSAGAARLHLPGPTKVSTGERRRPHPQGRPGFVRVDTVHQGDFDGAKGLYHLNSGR